MLRVGCPISILHLSTAAVLGEYYLFITFLTFAVFFISLEAAVPFSHRYLQANSDALKSEIFNKFIISQLSVSSIPAIPLFLYYIFNNSISILTATLFYLALVTSACSNETGRFFWNIGKGDVATKRDLWRSLTFVAAIILSVNIYQTVVSEISLVLIVISETVIVYSEIRRWGSNPVGKGKFKHYSGSSYSSISDMLQQFRVSLPQVLHLQILAIFPFLERTMIDRSIGLEAVGAFSFNYAGVQAGLSLLLMPLLADGRRAILSAHTPAQHLYAHKMTFVLLTRITIVSAIFTIAAYIAVPLFANLMHKDLELQPIGSVAVMISAIASTYNSAISPLYAKGDRILSANLITLMCTLPMVCLILFIVFGYQKIEDYVFPAIVMASVLQISARVFYNFKKFQKLVLETKGVNY